MRAWVRSKPVKPIEIAEHAPEKKSQTWQCLWNICVSAVLHAVFHHNWDKHQNPFWPKHELCNTYTTNWTFNLNAASSTNLHGHQAFTDSYCMFFKLYSQMTSWNLKLSSAFQFEEWQTSALLFTVHFVTSKKFCACPHAPLKAVRRGSDTAATITGGWKIEGWITRGGL